MRLVGALSVALLVALACGEDEKPAPAPPGPRAGKGGSGGAGSAGKKGSGGTLTSAGEGGEAGAGAPNGGVPSAGAGGDVGATGGSLPQAGTGGSSGSPDDGGMGGTPDNGGAPSVGGSSGTGGTSGSGGAGRGGSGGKAGAAGSAGLGGGGAGSGGAGSGGVSTAGAGGTVDPGCNEIDLSSAPTPTATRDSVNTAPTYAGGEITAGTYYLTTITVYGPSPDCDGVPPSHPAVPYAFAFAPTSTTAGALEMSQAVTEPPTELDFDYTLTGSTADLTPTCGSTDNAAISYTATTDEFDMGVGDSTCPVNYVFELAP